MINFRTVLTDYEIGGVEDTNLKAIMVFDKEHNSFKTGIPASDVLKEEVLSLFPKG